MRRIDSATKLCAVIGNPVEHSLSPLIHNAGFEARGLDFVYLAFRVSDVASCLTGMRALPSFRGMSVTIPHKMAVMEHLDEIEPMARHVGCVNTITNDNGRLIGSTTDGPGTLRAFEEAGVSLDAKKVLFIGSGGAVRAVAFAVAELTGASRITLIGRTPERVQAIVDDLQAKTEAQVASLLLPDDLPDAMDSHDIIIQGTPVGMFPNPDGSCIPKDLLRPGHTVFDMVYRPHRTRLIQEAEAIGCKTIVGIEMLVNQAVLQFERWTGLAAPRCAMHDAAVSALTRS